MTDPALAALPPWLQAHGFADAHQAGPHGNTPLMHAAWRGETAIVAALLASGVDLHAANDDGNTALWLACVSNDPALVTLLVAAGLVVDHTNLTGATCLMYAASSSKPAIVQALLAAGADPLLTTQDDFSALDMAASLECLQLLRAAGKRQVAAAAGTPGMAGKVHA
jgi:ankyrin repeat protein